MAAAAHPALGIRGTNAVESSRMALIQQIRMRAANGSTPARMVWNANAPPARPPAVANTGGIQANRAFASACVIPRASTKYRVVQLVQRVYVVIYSTLATIRP